MAFEEVGTASASALRWYRNDSEWNGDKVIHALLIVTLICLLFPHMLRLIATLLALVFLYMAIVMAAHADECDRRMRK